MPVEDRRNNRGIQAAALREGYEVVDTSYDLERIRFYDECDLHVGYRVHSHLYFLSQRRPSFLLHEDGRGRGMSSALNVVGVDAFERTGPFWRRGIKPGRYSPRDADELPGRRADEQFRPVRGRPGGARHPL